MNNLVIFPAHQDDKIELRSGFDFRDPNQAEPKYDGPELKPLRKCDD